MNDVLNAALQERHLNVTYLVILFHGFPRSALAGLAVDSAAATVPSAALHKEAPREEDHVGQLQLLSQVDGVVPGSAAVTLGIIVEHVQVHCKKHTLCEQVHAVSKNTQHVFRGKGLNMSLGSQLLLRISQVKSLTVLSILHAFQKNNYHQQQRKTKNPKRLS